MPNIEVKIEGLSDLQRQLRAFGPTLAQKGIRGATLAGAKVIIKEAKRHPPTPYASGLMIQSLRNVRGKTDSDSISYQIIVAGVYKTYVNSGENRRAKRVHKKYMADGPAFYGKFQEFGWSGVPGRHWLGKAFDRSGNDALDAVKASLQKSIEKLTAAKQVRTASR